MRIQTQVLTSEGMSVLPEDGEKCSLKRSKIGFISGSLKLICRFSICHPEKEWPLFPTAILGLVLRSFGGLAAQRSEDRQHNHRPKDSR